MNRRDFHALQKVWAKQEPAQGCDRVVLALSAESVCSDGGDVHARIELDHATALWMLRELAKAFE